jgi:uncharacterized protein YegP (UPF0339 family)
MTGRTFEPSQSDMYPPESCGYAIRCIKINSLEETLEVKNPKNKHTEVKFSLSQLKGIMLNSSSKAIIKQKKNSTSKPNQDLSKLIQNEYIPFMLLYANGKIDLIAQNYTMFKALEGAIEEIQKNRKILNSILKNCE